MSDENSITSVRVDLKTKNRLDTYKLVNEETHNNLLNRLLDELDQLRKIPQKNKKLML